MTSGLVLLDRTPFSFYRKQWGGTDYGEANPPSGLTSYWKRVDHAISTAQSPGFVKVVGNKKLPKRATREEHAYSVDRVFFIEGNLAVYVDYTDSSKTDVIGTFTKHFWDQYGVGYSSDFDSIWGANDDIALLGKAREKIVGSDFDLGVFLGEGREALSLITNTATRTLQYLRALRRGDVSSIAKSLGVSKQRADRSYSLAKGKNGPLQAAAEANLALQYGWLPLLKDAEGAAQALAQQLHHPAVQTYRARIKRKLTGVPVTGQMVGKFMYNGDAFGQMICRLSEVNVPGLNGLIDPSSIVWETMPYSFVADWFIPIGSYLQARGLSNFTSGTYVKTVYKREEFVCNGVDIHNSARDVASEPSGRTSRYSVIRTVSSSLDVPLPSFKPLSSVPSWKRAANAVSLLVVGANRFR